MSSAGDFDAGTYSPPHQYHTSHGRSHSPPPARYGHRSLSPDYHSGGGPYASGALPPRIDHSRPRIEYEHPDVFFAPPPGGGGLQPPRQHIRPRSVPPPMSRDRDRDRDERRRRDDEYDPEDPHKNSHNPIGKVQHVLHHTFSQSTSGLGVGVLGAIVGGLSAREASLAASRRGGHAKGGNESDKAALLSTIVGAAVGGLGANALEKRIESNRKKGKDEQEAWERKWGKDGGRGDRDRGDKDRDRDRDARGSRELVRVRDRDVDRDRDGERDRGRDGERDHGRRGGLADDYYFSDDDSRDHVYDDRNGNRRSQSRHR